MLSVKNVHKKFTKSVLQGVTIEANADEVIGIAGENGSGKSTLLAIMTGLLAPDAGQVDVYGSIGYVPQETALFEDLTIKDNIKFWSAAYNVPYVNNFASGLDSSGLDLNSLDSSGPDSSGLGSSGLNSSGPDSSGLDAGGLDAGELDLNGLDLSGLDFKKKVKFLSGGMKKRLSIAIACLHQPNWLVMDEPSASLDINFKGELNKMIIKAKSQNRGVIFTTHQPDELLWCDRIYILREGVFIYEGSPKEIGSLSDILYGRS